LLSPTVHAILTIALLAGITAIVLLILGFFIEIQIIYNNFK
jgi:hypothetical protein